MKNSKFLKLQKKWDEKLKKSGFKDIESRATGALENNSTSGGTIDKRRVTWELQAEYYRLATHFSNDHTFKSEFERVLWEYHSNGLSVREITETINKVKSKKTDKTTVQEILVELRDEMKRLYKVHK
jgi:hypothetical protein